MRSRGCWKISLKRMIKIVSLNESRKIESMDISIIEFDICFHTLRNDLKRRVESGIHLPEEASSKVVIGGSKNPKLAIGEIIWCSSVNV